MSEYCTCVYSGMTSGCPIHDRQILRIKQLENENRQLIERLVKIDIMKPNIISLDSCLQQEISSLKQQLEREKKCTDFYADPENYIKRGKVSWVNKEPEKHELILNYKHPKTDWIGAIKVGGKLARETQKAREITKKINGDKNEL